MNQPVRLPTDHALIRCDSASPQVVCTAPARLRVTMHPPRQPGQRVCGNHVTVLCEHCLDLIVDHVRRTFAHARAGGPPPACPVCGMPFTHIHHIVREVENL